MTPGMAIRENSFQSTFLCNTWLIPDAPVVKVSTKCTLADARAGGTPITLTSKVEQITPKAMPSAPSINCAAKPIRMKGAMSCQSSDEKNSTINPQLPMVSRIAAG